jgi:hypothetical protein
MIVRSTRRIAFKQVVVALAFLFVATMAVYQASRAFSTALTREIRYKLFEEALILPPENQAITHWQDETRPLDREFTNFDRIRMGRATSEAWRALAAGQNNGDDRALADYFSGVALQRAERSIVDSTRDQSQMVILTQTARPEFYHKDGSVLQLSTQALTVRFIKTEEGLGAFTASVDNNITTLLNLTAGWRVFSHERRGIAPPPNPPRPSTFTAAMAGINYYPAEFQWTQFWDNFDAKVIAQDFAKIRDLNGNSIRIFLPYNDFSDPKRAPENLGKLSQLLNLAEKENLWVVPTLFDLKPNFSPATWAGDVVYLNRVMPVLAASDRVAYIDLKNEADLDFEAYGRAVIEAWIKSMVLLLHQDWPDLRLTVGWSHAEFTSVLADDFDVITYHEYDDLEGTENRLADIIEQSGGKPVYVTEIGATSWGAVAGRWPSSPKKQAEQVAQRLAALSPANGSFVWTLHDFESPDPAAVGGSPWVKGLQSHYGLYGLEGQEKPAAEVVRAAFKNIVNGE